MKNICCFLFLLLTFSVGSACAGANSLEFRRVPDSPGCIAMCRSGNYLYTGGHRGLAVYDLKDADSPRPIARIPGIVGRQMALQGNTLYVTARENGLWILDISNPAKPVVATRFDTVELATGIAVAGNTVFIAERIYGIEIIDCSDRKNPRHLGLLRGGEIQSLAFRAPYLYAGSWGHGRIHIWDVANLNSPREVGRLYLDGYGDGLALAGSYCYAATGMHAKHGPAETRKNRGHGLEIFDISNPSRPVKVGGVKFPSSRVSFFDSWTVAVNGDTAYVADTNNGFFAVDVSDRANPVVTASGKLPRQQGREDCVGAFSLSNGIVYVGGYHGGLYTLAWKNAKAVKTTDGSWTRPAVEPPKEVPGFLRYDAGGQVRRLFRENDLLYAACSNRGLLQFQITKNGLSLLRRFPMESSCDVAVRDGKIYSAEGRNGLAVYRIDGTGSLKELGRYRKPCGHIRLTSDPRWMITSSGGMEFFLLNISDPANIISVFQHRGGGIFYTDTVGEFDKNGIVPVNRHGGGIVWMDLNGEKPMVKFHSRPFASDQMSAPCLLGEKFLFPAGKDGCFLVDPRSPERKEFLSLPGLRLSGAASADGAFVVFTNRANGDITGVDFSDPAHPEIRKERSRTGIPGSPGRAVFWNHRMLIPAGFYGILMEKERKGDAK